MLFWFQRNKNKATMTKLTIFAILILVLKARRNDANGNGQCKGHRCQPFSCEPGQQCCFDPMSGTHYCSMKCNDMKTQMKTSGSRSSHKPCEGGRKCGDICCYFGEICCDDFLVGSYCAAILTGCNWSSLENIFNWIFDWDNTKISWSIEQQQSPMFQIIWTPHVSFYVY